METEVFSIGADGVDVEAIVARVHAAVEEKLRDGRYRDAAIARAELANLPNLAGRDEFLGFYMDCLRESACVDINDFDIRERRQWFGAPLRVLKRVIWNLLKFYTYRLWSQQNQINGLLAAAVEGIEEKHRHKILDLEARIASLEVRAQAQGDECGARKG